MSLFHPTVETLAFSAVKIQRGSVYMKVAAPPTLTKTREKPRCLHDSPFLFIIDFGPLFLLSTYQFSLQPRNYEVVTSSRCHGCRLMVREAAG